MIDISSESLLTISQAAKSLPGRPHTSTLWRWVNRGVRNYRLETCMIGGRRFTSQEALARFFRRLSGAVSNEQAPLQTSCERTRADAEADKILDRAGI